VERVALDALEPLGDKRSHQLSRGLISAQWIRVIGIGSTGVGDETGGATAKRRGLRQGEILHSGPSMHFPDRSVWITGASSGIGEALAHAFAREGARLVLSARREAELERVRRACDRPEAHLVVPLDLAQSDTFPSIAADVLARGGGIDVLVNNGGVSQRGLAAETTLAVERQIMEIDYFGAVALTKAVLPAMRARRRGHVVVVSSVMGYVGTPMRSTYAAAKHALHGYFDSLRAEVWRDGIKVTIACPGYVRTAVSDNALTADGARHAHTDRTQARGIAPGRCAAAIVRAVARGREEVAVGGPEIYGIWLQRLFPRLFSRLARRMNLERSG
jgi:short-subunit dehydrogenase